MFYSPLGFLFYLGFWALFAFVAALIQIGILHYVFERMGVSPRYMLLLLVLSLLGSYINIPVLQLPGEPVRAGEAINFFGVQYTASFLPVSWRFCSRAFLAEPGVRTPSRQLRARRGSSFRQRGTIALSDQSDWSYTGAILSGQ